MLDMLWALNLVNALQNKLGVDVSMSVISRWGPWSVGGGASHLELDFESPNPIYFPLCQVLLPGEGPPPLLNPTVWL